MRIRSRWLALVALALHSASFAALSESARKADAELNATYERLTAGLNAEQKQSLRNAQRAWIAFRDSACSFESRLKASAPRDSACVQALTLERLAHLRRYEASLKIVTTESALTSPPAASQCRLDNLPAGFTVQAVGVYEGAIDTDVQLTSSGNETKVTEVVVNHSRADVVLVLMAYDPVVWHIKRTSDSRIAAVIVGGYHTQAVLGIERSVPLLISTHEGRRDCGKYFYAYEAGPSLLQANEMVRRVTGREIDHLWSNYKGSRVYVGTPPAASVMLKSSSDYRPEDYTDLPRFPSGQKGIDRLIELGLMRRALPQDLDAWVEKASARYKKFNPNLAVAPPSGPRGTYVVLGKTRFPAGLYGGNSVAFLIPPGIPLPDGTPGHSAVYYLEDGSCRGAVCPEGR